MNKTSILLLGVLSISLFLLFELPNIQNINSTNTNTTINLNGWVFANSTRWNIASSGQQGAPVAINGNFMLASTYRDNTYGFQYETALYQNENITDGIIDAWVYSNDAFGITGIVLRAGYQTASGCYLGVGHSTTLCQGYVLRLYTSYAALDKLNSTGDYAITTPTQYNLPGGTNYNGVWWHLRLQANGPQLEGWVTQNTTISGPPQLMVNDTTYTSGFMGLTARTQNTNSLSASYYDAMQISTLNPTFIKENQSFEPNGWIFANSTRWNIAFSVQQVETVAKNGNFMLASTYLDNNYLFQYETA